MASFDEYIFSDIRDHPQDFEVETYPVAQHIAFRCKSDGSKVTVEFFGPMIEVSLYYRPGDTDPVYRRYTKSEIVRERLQEAINATRMISENNVPNELLVRIKGKPV